MWTDVPLHLIFVVPHDLIHLSNANGRAKTHYVDELVVDTGLMVLE